MKIQWLGGPTFILDLGTFRLLNDPVFGTGEQAFVMPSVPASELAGQPVGRLAPVPDHDIDELDAVVLTRLGEDHFDRVAGETVDVGNRMITPVDDPEQLIEYGFTDMEALEWGQSFEAERGGETLQVTAVPTSFADERRSNGYVARHTAGGTTQTVYWTGDTRWFPGARRIKELSERFDLLIPFLGAVGGSGTLDGKEAMQFVFMTQPKRIVPVNYHTFSHYEEGIDDFRKRIDLTMYEKRLQIIAEGESFEREPAR